MPKRLKILSAAGILFWFILPTLSHAQLTPVFGESSSLLPDGSILVVGGETTANPPATARAQLINPNGTVTQASTVNLVALSSHTATVLPNGLVLVAGGVNSTNPGGLNTTEIYNPTAKTWALGPNLSVPRFGHTATLLGNGTVLLCGGYVDLTGVATATCDIYTPDMSGFFGPGHINLGGPGPTMSSARAFHSASLLSGGNVFMAGGVSGGAYLDTTEIYNAQNNSFTGGPALPLQTAFHTATAMGDGRVLIAGGKNTNNNVDNQGPGVNESTSAVQIYDPASGFSPGAPMNENREKFAANLDANGNINVAGGLGTISPASDSYPALQVSGSIVYSGTSFSNQTVTPANATPILLKLSVNTAGIIVGGFVSFPASSISFSSGTINVAAFDAPINGQGTCIDTSGGTYSWACGEIQIKSLPPLSGTINCTTLPCSSPINLTPSGTTMSGASGNAYVAVVISSMVFADVETYNPQQNAWTLNTAALAGPPSVAFNIEPTIAPYAPYNTARFAETSLLSPMDTDEIIGGASWNQTSAAYVTQASIAGGADVIADIESFTQPGSGPSLPGPRAYHTTTTLPDGRMIIAGGQDVSTDTLNTSLIFDPNDLTFSTTAPLNVTRDKQTATLLPNGNVLITGGENVSTGTLSSCEIYNSTGSAWTVTASMNQAREYHTATILPNGNVLVVGGVENVNNYLNSAEIYYSTSATWALTTSIPASLTGNSTGLSQQTATLLQDGSVLITGGQNAGGHLSSAEIYDPTTQAWSTATSMPVPLVGQTATLLSNGNVLVAGGDNGVGEQAGAYIYNPASNSWSITGSLTAARFDHNAVLLPNGGVLVSGGFTTVGAVGTLEIYDPYAGAWAAAGSITPKAAHTTNISLSGVVFDIGGLGSLSGGNYLAGTNSYFFTATPDLDTVNAPPSIRQPFVNAINLPVLLPGAAVTVTGGNFHGVTEASGGGASSANSDQDKPRLVLSATDNGTSFMVDLTTAIYANSANLWSQTNSSITVTLPATNSALPYGWYQLREGANAQYSSAILVHAGPPLPSSPAGIPQPTVLGISSVSWTWSAAPGTFDGYDVYQATTGVFLSTDATTSYIETSLAPNTTVQLLVAPYTISGDGPGATSGITYTLAAVPQNLFISSDTGSSLALNWYPNGNSPGTVYEISESTDGFVNSFSTPIPSSLDYTSTQAVISPLQMDTSYYFRVRAFNYDLIPSAGFSNIATTITVNQVFSLSGAPVSPTSISWSWTSASLPSGGYFAVYNATTTPPALIGTTGNTQFTDSGLDINSPRSVEIAAVTSSGQGPFTSSATIYTDAAPPAPVSPAITAISTSGFLGQWATNGNPNYTLYICSVTAFNVSTNVFTSLTTTASSSSYCDVTGLPLPGTWFQTQVFAINGDGIESSPLLLGTSEETLAAPPQNLAVTGTTAGSISVAWSTTTNSSLDTYQITYSTDSSFAVAITSAALAFSANSNQSTDTIMGLIGGYTYYIRGQAQNQNGVLSAFSNVVSTLTFNNGAPPGSSGIYVIASSRTYESFTLSNGETGSILINANSFSQNVILVISPISTSPPLCPGTGSSIGISITASPAIEPTTPLSLTLSYTPMQVTGLNLNTASLLRVTGPNACVPVETTVNQPAYQFTATLNHISQFEFGDVADGTSVKNVSIYPNPLYPSRGNGYVTFQNLPAGARVRIYTVMGSMVFEGTADDSGLFHWPGTNRGGRLVASGVYLVYVTYQGTNDIYKVAVER